MFFPNIFFCVFPGGEFVVQRARGLYKESIGTNPTTPGCIVWEKIVLLFGVVQRPHLRILRNYQGLRIPKVNYK
uniref:Uncharacterized protein n=1 Tax=Lutzomyia longipalpis TaxID=7200 RepID=A0A1B0CNG2_LUTLO